MRIATGAGTILAQPARRAVFLSRANPRIGDEETIEVKLRRSPSWCVCLSVWLGRDIYIFAYERGPFGSPGDGDRIDGCALAVLSFPLLSRLSAGIFRAGVLPTIIFGRRRRRGRKTVCKIIQAGNEENTEEGHTDSRRRTKMRRDREMLQLPKSSLRFFSCENSGRERKSVANRPPAKKTFREGNTEREMRNY